MSLLQRCESNAGSARLKTDMVLATGNTAPPMLSTDAATWE